MIAKPGVLYALITTAAVAIASLSIATVPAQAQNGYPSARDLIGHWRYTWINYGEPWDENLVFTPDGKFRYWEATPAGRKPVSTGTWAISGRSLTITEADGGTATQPVYMHDGKLVLPNVPDRRKFYEKVE